MFAEVWLPGTPRGYAPEGCTLAAYCVAFSCVGALPPLQHNYFGLLSHVHQVSFVLVA